MKTKKMQSLKKFEIAKKQMQNNFGGRPPYREQRDIYIPTASIGTYVDGMSWGTDGYGD